MQALKGYHQVVTPCQIHPFGIPQEDLHPLLQGGFYYIALRQLDGGGIQLVAVNGHAWVAARNPNGRPTRSAADVCDESRR